MQQLTQPGDPISYTVGGVTITLQLTVDGAYARNVFHGPNRINELCASHSDERMARTTARHLATCLRDGISLYQLIGDRIAANDGVFATTAQIVNTAPTTLTDTVPAGEHRQVRATVAGAHLTPLADAQNRAIRTAAQRGSRTVYAGEETRPTLKALARKGYGVLNFQPGLGRRKVIESLTLNARGLAQANQLVAA